MSGEAFDMAEAHRSPSKRLATRGRGRRVEGVSEFPDFGLRVFSIKL